MTNADVEKEKHQKHIHTVKFTIAKNEISIQE